MCAVGLVLTCVCFLLQVLKPILEKFGVNFDCDIRMRSVSYLQSAKTVQLNCAPAVCKCVFVSGGTTLKVEVRFWLR